MRETPPLTSGIIPKQVMRLALPVLLAMSVQTLYALANLFFVGRLGAQAVAGLSISLNAFFLVLTLGQSLGVGGLALISQAWGKQEFDKAREIFTQVMWIVLGLGLFSWAIAYFGAEYYISVFTQDTVTKELGLAYFRVYSATFFLQLFLMVVGFCYRGSGDFMTPMRIMMVSVVLNIILDPLLIYGIGPFPELGVRGAAIASVFSQCVSCVVLVRLICLKRHNLYIAPLWRPRWQTIKEILKIGMPSGLQYLLLALVIMITYRWIRPLGPQTAAAVGVGFRLLHSSYLPMVAFSVATSALVGQNWGAGILARARSAFHWGLLFTNGWSLLITSLLLVFPEFFLRLFSSDTEVVAHGILYLRVFGLSNLLVATIFISTAAFQGLGRTTIPLVGAGLKILFYLATWYVWQDSHNLYLIYGASLFGILVEFTWDLTAIKRALR